ncbi:hypothetical protein MKW92_042607 [Papaver armeniacum]|nr:hypothetical protein MKW92_042607 [Papaver armeniacum]
MGMQTDKVRFNVGGKIFETTATTLASVSRNSMFGAMIDYDWNLQPREVNKECFIDRNPDCFSVLLDLLTTGELYVPPHIPDKLFYSEALYYGLLDQGKAAKFFEFHSNRLKLTSSVRGQGPGNCNAIRASPDGGCAVAHGSVVRIYDWMLEEHPPLNLDYRMVNDIEWIDSENLVMSVFQGQNLSWEVGGIGVISSSTGKLRHRFQLTEEKDKVKGFEAGALCFNSDNKIFASCSGKSNKGIGVWDQVTGKLTSFFDSIQWLNGSNCLFAYSCFNSKSRINLLDFRDKGIVWSWSDDKFTCSSTHGVDAIPVGESNSVCVVCGSIRDFSIGGDWLFALHSEENVFDVRFNVRGKIFETTATTLASVSRNSMFGAMFDDEWNLQPTDVNKEYFIDRNPDCFSVLLDLLGTGELHVPPNLSEKLLCTEAHYYGLLEHAKAAKFCKLDCNRLRLGSSVRGQASGNCTAISASPNGGCAVAHSRVVRLYDWTLEEHPPINFNYQIINDVGWIDSESILISARKRPEQEDSGLALFNSSTGDLTHSFELNHENQVKGFSAKALCFNSDGKIAASCSTGTNIYGTGVWDQVTGEQTDFFLEPVWSPSVMQIGFSG